MTDIIMIVLTGVICTTGFLVSIWSIIETRKMDKIKKQIKKDHDEWFLKKLNEATGLKKII